MRDIGGYLVALKWSMSSDLRRQARRDLLDRLRHRLGRRPFLHRLRAAAAWLRERALRGQADRHAGRRRLLARDRGLQGRRVLHRADRLSRRAQGGPGGQAAQELFDRLAAHSVPRRRARRSRHGRLGGEALGRPGRRSLVADGDGLADRRQSGRPRHVADQARARRPCRCRATTFDVVDEAAKPRAAPGRWARSSSSCRCRPAACRRSTGQDERMRESYLSEFPGYYKTSDAGLHRRGWLSHHPRPHRRHHQCRGPSAVDRRHGGGGRLAPGRRGMRGAWRQGRDQGRAALRVSWS